jgi:hypothetical protein
MAASLQIRRCVMRYPQHTVSLATFGLAFALVLSPTLLQTEPTCTAGDTTLSALEFDVAGENLIVFDPQERMYDVLVPESLESAMIRAIPSDPNAMVSYVASFGEEVAEAGEVEEKGIGMGGGEALFTLPPGESSVVVIVEAPEGAKLGYAINVIRGTMCP